MEDPQPADHLGAVFHRHPGRADHRLLYLIINIIIYQYNTAIFENLMAERHPGFEDSAGYYLGLADEARIIQEVERFKRRRPRFLNLAFFKEKDGRLEAFFTYPEDLPLKVLDPNGPLAKFKSGFLKAGGVLYHGVQQRASGYAALILETLNQDTFDAMPPIGDFKVMFMGAGGNAVSAPLHRK